METSNHDLEKETDNTDNSLPYFLDEDKLFSNYDWSILLRMVDVYVVSISIDYVILNALGDNEIPSDQMVFILPLRSERNNVYSDVGFPVGKALGLEVPLFEYHFSHSSEHYLHFKSMEDTTITVHRNLLHKILIPKPNTENKILH